MNSCLVLAGNLCRCPGYDKIVRVVLDAAVDGEISTQGMRQAVKPDSEIQFLPALSGGVDQQRPVRLHSGRALLFVRALHPSPAECPKGIAPSD